VAAAVLLPWVAHAALFLHPSRQQDRRWRAAWRTALLLGLLAAFVPIAWLLALVLAALAFGVGMLGNRATWWLPRTWGPVAVAVGMVPVFLLPWSLMRFLSDSAAPWYAEAGLVAADLVPDLGAWELLGGRAATTDLGAAPAWLSLGVAIAAVAALLRRNTRPTVVVAWSVGLLALATAVLLDAAGEWASPSCSPRGPRSRRWP
jgi:hypothetical protein